MNNRWRQVGVKWIVGTVGWRLMGLVCLFGSHLAYGATDPVLTHVEAHALEDGKVSIDFAFDGPVEIPKSFKTEKFSHIVLDFAHAKKGVEQYGKLFSVGVLHGMNVVEVNHRLRAVLSVKSPIQYHVLSGSENHIYVMLGEKAGKMGYTDGRLSLNFQDIQVRAVLQLLAEFSGFNIVASDGVVGNITLRLNNVPWDEALAIILKTRGLVQRKVGDVLMIAPSEEIMAREKEILALQVEAKVLEPLTTQLVQLNYAKAKDMAGLLQDQGTGLVTVRGHVIVDERTNTLLISDTAESVQQARGFIERLDRPVEQILIEARIVNVDTDFEKELGIQFGVTGPSLISGANVMQNLPLSEQFNVNLPSGKIPGTLGVALANLGKGYLLDLEIAALESEGRGELISSPRLVTANQHEAVIEQGEEIPYQKSTSGGATSVEFKKAVLALRVTPRVTADRKIMMDLKINQDRRSHKPEILGVPAIATQQIETQVLVGNGHTIVLGGVYQEDKRNTATRVPFFGDLPWVGHLFRHSYDSGRRRELLIFITPKVILSEMRAA